MVCFCFNDLHLRLIMIERQFGQSKVMGMNLSSHFLSRKTRIKKHEVSDLLTHLFQPEPQSIACLVYLTSHWGSC